MTLEQTAALANTSNQQVWRLEKGERELTVRWMERLADALACAPSDFLPQSNVDLGPEPIRYLPLISWVQAGKWTEIDNARESETYERLLPVTRRYSNRAFALRVVGDSMSAPDGDSFPDGAIIVVDPNQEAKNGSYVVVRTEGSDEATFKQLVIEGNHWYLRPRNPRYPIIEVTGEAAICGVVRQMVMDFD